MPGRSSDLSRIGVDDGGGLGPVEEIINTVVGFLGICRRKGEGGGGPRLSHEAPVR